MADENTRRRIFLSLLNLDRVLNSFKQNSSTLTNKSIKERAFIFLVTRFSVVVVVVGCMLFWGKDGKWPHLPNNLHLLFFGIQMWHLPSLPNIYSSIFSKVAIYLQRANLYKSILSSSGQCHDVQ